MGASTSEIDRQIRETREHVDANLAELETRAISRAKTALKLALAAGAGLAAAAAVVVLVRRRRHSAVARLEVSMRDLPREVGSRLKQPLPSVKGLIAYSEETPTPGIWESTWRKVVPAIAAPAAGAVAAGVISRLAARRENDPSGD